MFTEYKYYRKYLDSMDTVCMHCVQSKEEICQTCPVREICQTCPVRKSVDYYEEHSEQNKVT